MVRAETRNFAGHPGIEDLAGQLGYAGGCVATLTSVWHNVLSRPSLRQIEAFFENGYYALDQDFSARSARTRAGADRRCWASRRCSSATASSPASISLRQPNARRRGAGRCKTSAFLRNTAARRPASPSCRGAACPRTGQCCLPFGRRPFRGAADVAAMRPPATPRSPPPAPRRADEGEQGGVERLRLLEVGGVAGSGKHLVCGVPPAPRRLSPHVAA